MFFDDNKKAITTIMSKRGPKGGEKLMDNVPMKPEVVKDEAGEVDGRHVAAQDMIGAFHEKSPEKLMHALMNFMDVHESRKDAESVD